MRVRSAISCLSRVIVYDGNVSKVLVRVVTRLGLGTIFKIYNQDKEVNLGLTFSRSTDDNGRLK